MAQDDIRQLIIEAVDKWKYAQLNRKLYGPNMPQTSQAIDECFAVFSSVLPKIHSLSIVKKEEELKVLSSADVSEEITLNAVSILDDFKRLYMTSLTIYDGVERQEIEALFDVMKMDMDEVKKEGGLKKLLSGKKVTHIDLDQMRYELLKEDEQKGLGGTGQGTGKGAGSGTGTGSGGMSGLSSQKTPKTYDLSMGGGLGSGGGGGTGNGSGGGGKGGAGGLSDGEKQLFASSWQGYLEGNIGKDNFSSFQEDFVEFAKNSPEELAGVVGNMMEKQKEVEKFLANLEKKLFDLGFPEEAIDALKKKLSASKQVTISEDELLRLRKIESKFEDAVQERLEDSLRTIDKIKVRLNDEQERSDAILRQVCQGAATLDENGKILNLNPVAEKALGVSSKEARGKTLNDVLKEHHMLSIVDGWQAETEDFIPKEVKVRFLDETTLDTIRESSVVIEDDGGRPIGVVSSLQDVVEHQEIKTFRQDLLDVLGHDLRVPVLAAKHSMARLLEDEAMLEKIGEEGRKFMEICKKSVESTEKMVKKILDVRQIETGKMLLKKEQVNIDKVIDDVITPLYEWAHNKDVTIQVMSDKTPDINMDPERIYQVIMNLTSNALKFTPEKGDIKVSSRLVEDGGVSFVEVSVSDTGIGIEKEDLKRIFTKYEQVSLVSPKGKSGLGLGLALCKMLIGLHNGSIWAESEKDKGSTFVFRLPVNEE